MEEQKQNEPECDKLELEIAKASLVTAKFSR